MIPQPFINAWRRYAPWESPAMIEQDLIISRAVIDIFNDPYLSQRLAFRGGTALHKLFLQPTTRYSEDIDLVQVNPEPIGESIDRFRKVLYYLGKPIIKQKNRNTTLIFRFESEVPPIVKLRLKLEINCREHFTVFGYKNYPFSVKNRWFTGKTNIKTYIIEELLGSKMRALYQRKKGRDLFDIWYSQSKFNLNLKNITKAFNTLMKNEEHPVSKTDYIANIDLKLQDSNLRNDTEGLLRPNINYDIDKAWEEVCVNLIQFWNIK